MKTILSLLFGLLIIATATAQEKSIDVLYLKNGSIIKGEIIEQVPGVSLKIQTADGSVFVYKMEDIERITREFAPIKNSSASPAPSKLRSMIDIGYAVKMGNFGMDRIKLHITNGARLGKNVSLGSGVGLHYYHVDEVLLIPVYANLHINFIDGPASPYISFSGGYTFNTKNDFKGEGLYLNPVAGVSFKAGQRTMINIGVGYDIQSIRFVHGRDNSGALSFMIGISN